MPRFSFASRTRLASALLALLPVIAFTPLPTQAASGADLLAAVPVVNEHVINSVACGQAAATMVLDYYLPKYDINPAHVGIGTVARYVTFSYRSGSPTGTSPTNLARGIAAAGTALGVPLAVNWEHTQSADWQTTLRQQLDEGQPVIVYLTDGGQLWGGAWHYAHYVVVAGLTASGQVVYHDPFDGREHAVAAATFARVWGSSARGHRTWSYLRITPGDGPATLA